MSIEAFPSYTLSPPLAVESYSGEIKDLREARRLLSEQCFRLEEARDLWMRQSERANRENAELRKQLETLHRSLSLPPDGRLFNGAKP